MKLKKVESENLYSYNEFKMLFQFLGGVTLILSKNLDQKTANGAGKSTILKIIFFLIYGKDLNDANKDSIPNRTGNGSYYGVIEFEENGHLFKIERFDKRKDLHPDKLSSPCINFFIDNQLFMTTAAKKDTPESIQFAINSKIKMSPNLFTSSILSKQNNNSNFLLANDTRKKEILSEILDLTSYGKAFELIKRDISEIEKRRKLKQSRIESFSDQIKSFQEEINEQLLLSNNFKNELDTKILNKKIIIQKEKKKFIETKNKIVNDLKDIALLTQEKDSLESDLKSKESFLTDEVSLATEISKLESELTQLIKDQQALSLTIKSIDSILSFEKDKQRHGILLGLEYSDATAQSLLSTTKIELSDISEKISKLNEILSNKNEKDFPSHINNLKMSLNDFANDLKNLNKELAKLESDIIHFESTTNCPTCLRDFDENHKRTHIEPKINELKNDKDKISQLIKDKNFEAETLSQSLSEAIQNNSQYSLFSESIKTSQELINSLETYIHNLTDYNVGFNQNKVASDLLDNKINELNIVIKSRKEDYSKFNNVKIEVSAIKEQIKTKNSEIASISTQKVLNDQLTKEVESIKNNGIQLEKELKNIQNEDNPYLKIIENLNKKIEGIKEQSAVFEKTMQADDDELHYLRFWAIGFSPAGIRSFISDDLVDLLNKKVQENLNDLFNGALGVLFESESENSKGVSVNKISTKFFLNGREVEQETLSGGQIARCVLATDLALMEVAESRSGTSLNVKFLDEPFNGIDSAGQLQAFRLFNKLAKNKDGFFVISHDENFQSMCANTIHILYKNENSAIVSKSEFDKYLTNTEDFEDENVFQNQTKTSGSENFHDLLKDIVFKKKHKDDEEE